MNRNFYIWAVLCLFVLPVQAQLVNNGATITIKDGATLVVDNNVENSTGSIVLENNAELKVSGHLTNSATLTANTSSTLTFYGDTDSEITSNAAVLGKLKMDKSSADLILLDALSVASNVTFNADNNLINLGSNNLKLLAGAGITGAGALRYFQADGDGFLTRGVSAVGVHDFPIGDADEYSPISIDLTAATIGTTNPYLQAKVDDNTHGSLYGDADNYISRFWITNASDITAYTATLTGQYTDADINGTTESNIKGASYLTDWSFAGADGDDAANTVSGDVTNLGVDFTGMNFYGKLADLQIFLQGAYSAGEMTTNLTSLPLGVNDGSHFPNESPYGTGETISSIPTDVTDWIKIDLWDANPPTETKSYSKFVKKDGNIIEPDGTTNIKFKDAPNSAIVVIHHRNHIDVRTSSTLDLISGVSFDFTASGNQGNIFNEGWSNLPQTDLGSSIYGMWSGNVNSNTNVRWNGPANDVAYLLNTILSGNKSTILSNVYSNGDLNFNKIVRWNGPANDLAFLLNTVLSGDKTLIINEHK